MRVPPAPSLPSTVGVDRRHRIPFSRSLERGKPARLHALSRESQPIRVMPANGILLACEAWGGGKLYILGGGWNLTTGGSPSAVAILLGVSWDLANTRHEWRLELVDSDDRPVLGPAPEGEERQPVAVTGQIEVGRPAGVPAGT